MGWRIVSLDRKSHGRFGGGESMGNIATHRHIECSMCGCRCDKRFTACEILEPSGGDTQLYPFAIPCDGLFPRLQSGSTNRVPRDLMPDMFPSGSVREIQEHRRQCARQRCSLGRRALLGAFFRRQSALLASIGNGSRCFLEGVANTNRERVTVRFHGQLPRGRPACGNRHSNSTSAMIWGNAKFMVWLCMRVAFPLLMTVIGACKGSHTLGMGSGSASEADLPRISNRDRLATSIGLDMVPVRGGMFQLGTKAHPTWEVEHRVTVTHDYWIAETEVTQRQWEQVMGNRPWTDSTPNAENAPAVFISWHDAKEFCKKLDSRERSLGNIPADYCVDLPSEAEWEIACRAGSDGAFCFGDDFSLLSEYAVWRGNSGRAGSERRVKSKKPNRYGLFDMHGNVWEWCADAFVDKPGDGVDPLEVEGDLRTVRGGAASWEAKYCRSASRYPKSATLAVMYVGFRPAIVRR